MNILVTGCNGYIGAHLVKQLKSKNYNVYGLDYKQCHNVSAYCTKIWDQDIRQLDNWNADLRNIKWDAICHLAALVSVKDSVLNPTDYYKTNWLGTVNLLKNLSYNHFIFASTGAAENATSPYGISKAAAEHSLQELSSNYTNFRFYNVVGEGEFQITNPDGLLAKLKEASKKGVFTIHGGDYTNTKDGTCVRDYIHVEDIANAICNAVKSKPANSPFECLGYGQSTTVKEFAEAYKKVNNLQFKIEIGPRREGDKEISEVPFVSSYIQQNFTLEDLVRIPTL